MPAEGDHHAPVDEWLFVQDFSGVTASKLSPI